MLFFINIPSSKNKFVEDTLLCSKWYPNAQLKHLRKNAFQYYKLWVNDTKNDKVPKINVTTEDINDNLDELGYHGTIGITSKHLLLRNFLRSKGVRVLEARFGSFVPTKLRTEIPTTIRQATYYVEVRRSPFVNGGLGICELRYALPPCRNTFFSFLMAELVNSEGELTNRSLFRVPPFSLLLFNPFLRSLILSQFLIKSMHERQEEQVEMMNYVQQRISQDEFQS